MTGRVVRRPLKPARSRSPTHWLHARSVYAEITELRVRAALQKLVPFVMAAGAVRSFLSRSGLLRVENGTKCSRSSNVASNDPWKTD